VNAGFALLRGHVGTLARGVAGVLELPHATAPLPFTKETPMTLPPRHLHLNAFLMSTGHHEASWRLPESDPLSSTKIEHYQHLARTAERGKLDSIFFADSPVLFGEVGRRPAGKLEPTVLLTAIAAVTQKIGLIATASTTYNDPFNLARRFASVDWVSGGRAGWNVVTTAGPDAARNFGVDDQPAHAVRYERAAEFIEVAQKLWDSWEDDAVLADKADGVWGDDSKIRAIEHEGKHFRVRGPLNVPRSPQGHPLIVQAGSSDNGKKLAAEYAEAVFTAHQTLPDAQAFYADLKARTAAVGRDPESIKILPGIVPVIGSTEAEALKLERELDELIKPEYAREQLAKTLRLKPEDLPLDRQLPADLPSEDEIEGAKSRYTLIVELARREQLTVRQLIGRLGGGRGHRTFSGTPEQVADAIQDWFFAGAADGFNIMPPVLPSGLEIFVDNVVPILQQRGLFRTEYTASTLRGHYGLARPENRFAGSTAQRLTSIGSAF
jgi:FMN-dependent oxidoreductase (nitrilotriacetate monooxygenase family)